jgi:hypothetical protein
LGVFISKEGKKKLGVWEDGKKLKWLTFEEGEAIENSKTTATTAQILKDIFENKEESYEKVLSFRTI